MTTQFIIIVIISLASGFIVEAELIPAKCVVAINGSQVEKSIGDTWNLTGEPCVKHFCELGGTGVPSEKIVREYCFQTCHNEYELITPSGECCGECVQTKCKVDGKVYKVGDMWKSTDNCTFYECVSIKSSPTVTSYKKSCQPISKDCPTYQMGVSDCCPYCFEEKVIQEHSRREQKQKEFVHKGDKYKDVMDPNTYLNHPCARECMEGMEPMICNYTFVIEWYETLSKACFDCPFNETDCYRPHCIFGDGMRRNILVINRMMPGPMLQVCYGDTLMVDVQNQLMGESTTIHWHGMHQKESPYMDGVPQVTQCAIQPHTTFRYTFKADHEGTHWWHSHTGVQRSDGALGALIVRKPFQKLPKIVATLYEFDMPEHTMIIQDWEHLSAVATFNSFHHSIGDNKPKNLLINGKGKYFEPKVETRDGFTIVDVDTFSKYTRGELPVSTELYPNDVDVIHGVSGKPEKIMETTLTPTTEEAIETMPSDDHPTEKHYSVNFGNSKVKRSTQEPILTPLEVYKVSAGKSYRFRTINAGFLNCPVEISVDNHNITVIASDGYYFEPVVVSTLVTYAGERFDFVLKADQPIGNYWVRVRGLMDCDERFTKAHQVAILRYTGANEEHPTIEFPTYDYVRHGLQMNALNRGTGLVESVSIAELTTLHPEDKRLLQPKADYSFYIYYDFYDKDNPHYNNPALYSNLAVNNVQNRFIGPQLNRITMKMPSSPFMLAKDTIDESKFCNETSLANQKINCSVDFCECNHVLQVPLNALVELIMVDEGYRYDANHPFHIHGHGFKVVAMERLRPTGINVEEIQALDEAGKIKRRLEGSPMKDTVTVPDGGYTIVRFIADNPGYWLFHCHIEYHVEVGMALVFKIGDSHQMLPAPKNFPTCSDYVPRMGDDDGNGSVSHRISFNVYVVTLLLAVVNLLL